MKAKKFKASPMGLYILDGHKAVSCSDIIQWTEWFHKADRQVAREVRDGIMISTIFLGLDHNFKVGESPILFETMVFGGEHDMEQERYHTWEEAEAGHAEMCKRIFGLTK